MNLQGQRGQQEEGSLLTVGPKGVFFFFLEMKKHEGGREKEAAVKQIKGHIHPNVQLAVMSNIALCLSLPALQHT